MNLDLYTDEYRNFKFLKCAPEKVAYFKTARQAINRIQPWDDVFDPHFDWPDRLEFCEQLLDLRHDTVYIVYSGIMTKGGYEEATLLEIEKPIVLLGNPIIYDSSRIATLDDIIDMEDVMIPHFCLCEEHSFDDPERMSTFNGHGRIIRIEHLPIVPFAKTEFTELFHNKETAQKYQKAMTDFIRYKMGAMSTIAARF